MCKSIWLNWTHAQSLHIITSTVYVLFFGKCMKFTNLGKRLNLVLTLRQQQVGPEGSPVRGWAYGSVVWAKKLGSLADFGGSVKKGIMASYPHVSEGHSFCQGCSKIGGSKPMNSETLLEFCSRFWSQRCFCLFWFYLCWFWIPFLESLAMPGDKLIKIEKYCLFCILGSSFFSGHNIHMSRPDAFCWDGLPHWHMVLLNHPNM